jgi:CHAT domain-containing protein
MSGAGDSELDQIVERIGAGERLDVAAAGFPEARHRELVTRLSDEVPRLVYVDLDQAERLGDAATLLAERCGEVWCRARTRRTVGHTHFSRRRYAQGVDAYQEAADLFEELGDAIEVGRTLSSSLQLLSYMGRHDEAQAAGERARELFRAAGDRLRLARLDTNLANLLHRQDRFQEALQLYRSAYAEMEQVGEPRDMAVALRNMAVCHISLNQFEEALECHRRARQLCLDAGFSLLAAEADYNIAYLYYQRGRYTQAIELYRSARERCSEQGDEYHTALCDLDQAELYLELNLVGEAMVLARQAFAGFERLGMIPEAAKALTSLAIGAGRSGEAFRGLELFAKARDMFVQEDNRIWPPLIDAYRALVLHDEGRHFEARRFAEAALEFFERSAFPSKAALCLLLLARIHLQVGETRLARSRCLDALERLSRAEAPELAYRAHLLLGQVEEAMGEREAAHQAYAAAHATLETMRSHLEHEELKIGFLKDKLSVYESLVWMTLGGERSAASLEAAFGYIEQAKSRSLADLMAFRAQLLPAQGEGRSGLAGEVQELREELNWYYRKIDLAELRGEPSSPGEVEALRRESRNREAQLLRTLRDLKTKDREFASLQDAATISVESIRSSLPQDSLLLEYYAARGMIVVAVLGHRRLDIVPLTPVSRVRHLLRLLQFQLAKFRLGPEYVARFGPSLQRAAGQHLRDLYSELLSPVRDLLDVHRLIIVPHDFLHYVPFHALAYGGRHVIDDFAVTYAPSASVHHLCTVKSSRAGVGALVMGVPDTGTPHIPEEVAEVAASLPGARVFMGEQATEARLRELGPSSRFVHIATHGLFRYDNPMFSSIQLGTSRLSLFDLYQLDLGAELVTLSGCGTGLGVVEGGDELIGLVRGLLYAGARSALVTLWDVNDRSTASFMQSFYGRLQRGAGRAVALQQAMLEARERDPHPYHWAPFILVGES